MKKHFSTIMLVIVFIIGLSIFIYPVVSDLYNKKVGSYAISEYRGEVKNVASEERENILKMAREYNENLLKSDPSFVNGEPRDEAYKSQLKLNGNNIIGYIEIKKINVKLPIYQGTSEPVLQIGIGHLEGSSLPIGGEGNHSVVSGHTGLPSAKLLTNLDKLVEGDKIVLNVFNETLTYSVVDINIVVPEDTRLLAPQSGRDLLTVFTCTPYGVNSHRLLVTAERVENDEEIIEDKKEDRNIKVTAFLGVPAGIIISFLIILRIKKKRKKGDDQNP